MTDDTLPDHEYGADLPLVAIGASAGGLEPLEHLFGAVKSQSGFVYVVIQHLSPDYRSMMDELLSRKSDMRIQHIDDQMQIEANTVYLNRPGMYVELHDNTFRTFSYIEGDGLPHLPIDRFFTSLATRSLDRTIAVVLSGSGSDGARGAKILHAAGGAVLVQSVQEAVFDSMPKAVLMAGVVDRVSDASDMPRLINDIFTYGKNSTNSIEDAHNLGIQNILKKLEDSHHIDFNNYKTANVSRRVLRRMHLRGHPTLAEYDVILSGSLEARDELYQDMLIGVTEFYRDRDAITTLRRNVLDKLAMEGDEATPLKIWVAACASGEEVYTLAIEMSEALRHAGSDRRFRIIGTDLHAESIEIASRGTYSEQSIAHVPLDLRERYFVRTHDRYIVTSELRQKIIFSVHNLVNDPPFMNLDLISCRNLLIYLREAPQASVLSMFLFGLKPEGHLFLGASETVGRFSSIFEVVDPRWRIFRKSAKADGLNRSIMTSRKTSALQSAPNFPQPTRERRPRQPFMAEVSEVKSREVLIRSYDALLKRFAPAAILLTSDGKVLNWFGAASAFIDTMNNLAEWTLLDIVHPDLHFAINVGTEKIRQGQSSAHSRRVKVNRSGEEPVECTVTVEALPDANDEILILARILLDGAVTPSEQSDVPILAASDDAAVLSGRIHTLEQDLRLTEETLQHVTERLEASSEELQASNEELQASNEELQASNEELQSSNEELHAVNDELVSVSAEHERKITELSELNANTEVVLRMLNTGVIVLDAEDKIRRFSQLIEHEFLLQEHDVGRSVSIVGPHLDFVTMQSLAEASRNGTQMPSMTGVHEGRQLSLELRTTHMGNKGQQAAGCIILFKWDKLVEGGARGVNT